MEVLVDLVVSLNGMIARENGDEEWLPDDGWYAFLKHIDTYENVIIGRKTYELVKEKYQHDNFDAIKARLKIIVTRQKYMAPNTEYKVVHSLEDAINEVERAGLKTAYVGGGGELCAELLNAGLADTLRLTVMPYIIPSGRSFVGSGLQKDIQLLLVETSKQPDGKLINRYKVKKVS